MTKLCESVTLAHTGVNYSVQINTWIRICKISLLPTWHESSDCLKSQTAGCTHHICMVSLLHGASDCGTLTGTSEQSLCRRVHICMASPLVKNKTLVLCICVRKLSSPLPDQSSSVCSNTSHK